VLSLWTYAIYKAYINPNTTGKKLVFITHAAVIVFSIAVIALAIGLGRANFDVSFITTCMGIIVNVCIIPMGCTLFWRKMSSCGMIIGTTLSTCISVSVWLGYAKAQSGVISLASLSTYEALAAGNTVAIGVPVFIVPIVVFFKPSDFDWNKWKTDIRQDDNSEFDKEHGLTNVFSGEQLTELVLEKEREVDYRMIRKRNIEMVIVTVFVLFFLILFPIPLYGLKYIFTKQFFRGYIIVTFLWVFFSVFVVTVYPIWESRVSIVQLFKKVLLRQTGETATVTGTGTVVVILDSDTTEPFENGTDTKKDVSQIVVSAV
jgi:hypothetical protein